MPLYEYKCYNCGSFEEEIRTVEERNNEKLCNNCNSKMVKIINSPKSIIFPFKMHAITNSGSKIKGNFQK